MTINLADNNPRIAYSVAQGVTQQTFAVPFEFFNNSDLSVYVDGVLKAEGTHYTLTGGDGSTGDVVFVTATPPDVQQVTGATGGSTVVITRNIPIERTSDFFAGADINRAALNEQLDILTAMIADLKNKVDRSPTLYDYDVVNYQMTIPPTAERSNKYLAFGATGDLVVASGTTSDIIVSAFGETLIDDANAAAALVTLGLTSTAAEINKLSGIPAGLTSTELGYVDGVTSAIQAQLNAKAPLTGMGASGTWGISISGNAASVNGKSINTLTAAGGIAYASNTTTLAAIGAGTAGQVLLSGGAGAPTFGSSVISGTAVASTSGTAITFTGIPSWAKRITLMFNETSTSGTSLKLVQIGSTTFTISGYASSSSLLTTGINTQQSTAGFVLSQNVAAELSSGAFTLIKYDGNTWVSTHAVRNNNPGNSFGAGIVTLSGVLDRIRITTVNGTDTFDAGSINILWE